MSFSFDCRIRLCQCVDQSYYCLLKGWTFRRTITIFKHSENCARQTSNASQINVFSMQIHFVHMDFSLTQFNRITRCIRWIFIWMHCVHCELSYRSNGIICGDQLEVLGKMAVAEAEVRPCIKVERSKWNGTEKKVHQIESNSLMKRIDYIFSTSFFVKMALLT